jgi:hypothetical protein
VNIGVRMKQDPFVWAWENLAIKNLSTFVTRDVSHNTTVNIFIAGVQRRARRSLFLRRLQCHPHFDSARYTFCTHARDIVLVTATLTFEPQKAKPCSTQHKKLMFNFFQSAL